MLLRRLVPSVLTLVVAGLGVGVAPAPVHAQPDPPQAAAADPLLQKETTAPAKVADELAGLARACATYRALDDARQAYARAMAFAGDGEKYKVELDKLKGKTAGARKDFTALVAAKRTKSLEKCAKLLAPVAAAHAQADRSDDLARLVALLRAQGIPFEGALAKLEVLWFAATLSFHLLEGKERAYRPAFMTLVETVHQVREQSNSFAEAFEGVDLDALDAEFREFCRALEIDSE